MNVESVRAAYETVRAEVGPHVTVVVATKYVSLEDMPLVAEAGVGIVGENRVQDLERKHAACADLFRWHFIGHLQSNKARRVDELCELVHSVDSDSAARRMTIPMLLEVNLTGEASKSGVAPTEVPGYVDRYPLIRGLMTMPPLARAPEDSRPWFRQLRQLAEEAGLDQLSMGTSQDWRIAVEEGATYIRLGSTLFGDR
jgi:pyridoxal phosphate enzyme (YggS family)